MALFHPLFSHSTSLHLPQTPKQPQPLKLLLSLSPPTHPRPFIPSRKMSFSSIQCAAVADTKPPPAASPPLVEDQEDHKVLVGPTSEAERRGERVAADYDWTEEWYPLYLTQDIPEDAPLGLTVFDKQLVLYRDGNGELQCYQDRCPHS